MKEQFVTYEIALKLKELGFDGYCFGYYSKQYDDSFFLFIYQQEDEHPKERLEAPLWQQAIDWFREEYKINCVVGYTDDDKEEFMAIIDRPNQDIDYNMNSTKFYQEAREQAILKTIELCQKEK